MKKFTNLCHISTRNNPIGRVQNEVKICIRKSSVHAAQTVQFIKYGPRILMNPDIINLQISEVVVSEEACGEVLPPLPLENKFYLYILSMSVQKVDQTNPRYTATSKHNAMQTLLIQSLFFQESP